MTETFHVRVQMGIKPGSRIERLRISAGSMVPDLASGLSTSTPDKISVTRMNLVYNGNAIFRYGQIPEMYQNITLGQMGIMKDSLIICILSSAGPASEKTQEQKEIEALGADESEVGKENLKIVLTCEFKKRPFGFAVWANAQGKNAIVTKVAGANALKLGIQIGFVVYKCNDELVYGQPHDTVLELLKTTPTPLSLKFADLGEEYTCAFTQKPLGFTVIQDREENNAKVSKINTRAAQNLGVLIGSYVVGVNTVKVFGMKHKAIIAEINRASFPINIIFRHPPPLLMLAPRSRRKGRTGGKR